jgi:hypothetical protein
MTFIIPGAGPAGTNGATWREGSGAPSDSLGVDGDFYLDTATEDVYLKAAGSYSVATNIKGSPGAAGSAGTNGATWRDGSGAPSSGLGVDGDFYLDNATENVYLKASGSYSIVTNIKGATGATGPNGTGIPLVIADNSSNQSLNGNNVTVTGWTESLDAGSNFVASTGIFTAPATGYYLFCIRLRGYDTGFQIDDVALIKNKGGTPVTLAYSVAQQGIGTLNQLVSLSVNDTVEVETNAAAGTPKLTTTATQHEFSVIRIT